MFWGPFRLCQWSWRLAWCAFWLVAHLRLWRAGTSESGWQRWWQLHRRMVRCGHGIDTADNSEAKKLVAVIEPWWKDWIQDAGAMARVFRHLRFLDGWLYTSYRLYFWVNYSIRFQENSQTWQTQKFLAKRKFACESVTPSFHHSPQYMVVWKPGMKRPITNDESFLVEDGTTG